MRRGAAVARAIGLAIGLAGAFAAGAPAANGEDLLGVATVGALPGQSRDVAVTVGDLAGTLLDEGDGANVEIQGFAFRLDFAPAQHVAAVTFLQAGVTAGRTPVLPVISPHPDYLIVLMSFDETSDPLTFTLNAPPPGDVIGMVRFTLSPATPLGTTVALTLAEASATLINDAATLSETVANGQLALIHGAIVVDSLIFADGFESGDAAAWSAVVGG